MVGGVHDARSAGIHSGKAKSVASLKLLRALADPKGRRWRRPPLQGSRFIQTWSHRGFAKDFEALAKWTTDFCDPLVHIKGHSTTIVVTKRLNASEASNKMARGLGPAQGPGSFLVLGAFLMGFRENFDIEELSFYTWKNYKL